MSEVLFSNIDLGDRYDAEFFDKKDLYIETILRERNSIELRNFGNFVASAFYPAATQLYEIGDTPFIRCVDAVNYPLITEFQNDLFEKLPFSFINDQSGINVLKKDDIVITKVGTPSFASIIYEHDIVALSRTVLGLKNINKINPFYLLVFLRSRYGFSQLQRHRELTIQYQLTLERTKRVLVFIPSKEFQSKIEFIIKNQIEKLENSRQKYAEAERLLLETLGLQNFAPSNEAVSVKTFKESFDTTGRLDAEYYQPKYEETIARIKENNWKILSNIVDISKSIEPGSSAYDDEDGLPFYRVSDYNKFGLNTPAKTLSFSYVNNKKGLLNELKPKRGTILFSKDGSVGTAYLLTEDLDGVTSGAILHLKVKEEVNVLPEYLTLALNSRLIQLQAERDAGGSIILHWRLDEIENVVVPVLDIKIQQQMAILIQESFALKAESEHLLEVAKRAVEIAIEQDEQMAIEFIYENSIF